MKIFQGLSGNEVAQATSDIILTNDQLSGTIDAVSWGRHIKDCIVKFVVSQLTFNIVACVSAFATAILIFEVPIPVSKNWLSKKKVEDKTSTSMENFQKTCF